MCRLRYHSAYHGCSWANMFRREAVNETPLQICSLTAEQKPSSLWINNYINTTKYWILKKSPSMQKVFKDRHDFAFIIFIIERKLMYT